ncbi:MULTISPECIES: GntR family transcriptional regulator [Streptomyces]|uniref:GntR family transcriptional regulator n=1 Tax=Streptomyces TaxID=1883 RepID=UPI001EFD14F5|nr:GntR family transcriptional regulator [Streptomyces cinnamoneus]
MSIDPDDPRLPSVQIADAIRKDIADEVLKPGRKLPTHKQLAERFGVATQTVQNGLRILREEGLIESAGARGSFVADKARQPDRPGDLDAIRAEVAQLKERVAVLEELVRHK